MKIFKNNNGFTLIEMMIVLLVISVLLIITIPNITKHNSKINSKGCEAFVKMVQAQVQAYEIEKKEPPADIQALVKEGYLTEGETSCPNGDLVRISAEGEVTSAKKETKSE
ncbi:prepilin-type N-terminal cleavage/methylation domain-containing protein [Cytobacillus depressus]|uniref:ComG operon protein 3 n=1 Tax=Cytobacillus depressus TaxID=1602942 RepID=A0A6L3VCV7_9BACI|nr:competence type IV pilus major pilin ComGC [Cytobacillus depressus]KAB2338503.1 prepilin-type N-terminal cleavage/methylation domain-containing protein [Cytobacillus depressus]